MLFGVSGLLLLLVVVVVVVCSAMVLSVLLHGAAESWALSRNQLSRLETLHNSWLRCITRDTVGRPDSISTKDLMEKAHQLPISVMIKEEEIKMARACCSSFGQ